MAGQTSVDSESVIDPEVTLSDVDPSILHLSPAERERQGITDDEVRRAFFAVVTHGTAAQKDLQGVTLPALTLDRAVIEGKDNHPVDLRGATIEGGISARYTEINVPIRLDEARVGGFELDESVVKQPVEATGITVTGEISARETEFRDDVVFAEATVEETVCFDRSVFADTITFEGARFAARTTFRTARFHGTSNALGDNTSFRGARFESRVDFQQAEFEYTHFETATFEGRAGFRETAFRGDAEFTDSTFDGVAEFDEARFGGDTSFEDVTFREQAHFRGARFAGGERALEDDATFESARFHDAVAFSHAKFRNATFADVLFEAAADFTECEFTADAAFPGSRFTETAVFDEARFGEDTDFSDVQFGDRARFRGIECAGGANVLEDDLTFEGAHFATAAEFHDADLTSAIFRNTSFLGAIDFTGSSFSDWVEFKVADVDADAVVDFTRATIKSGQIVQPTDGWVRYDLTLASIGDIELAAESDADYRRLLDYFRFCRTKFDEFDNHTFDFGAHRDYLDRNAWAIHEFHDPPAGDHEYALPLDPGIIETTYLKAKQSAQTLGDMKIAGEFRVKRQQFSRRKTMEVVRDETVDPWTRARNLARVAENYFLGLTCGHGMRPIRIATAFVLAPLLFAPFYAFGGPAFALTIDQPSLASLPTPDGLTLLYQHIHFSYISYTTIGYGFIGPQGPLARVFAGAEAFLSTILAALLVYALVKRSEL